MTTYPRLAACLLAASLLTLVSGRAGATAGPNTLMELAHKGDAKAQNEIGNLYYNGRGVRIDYAKAMFWYRRAAEQGNAAAEENLAGCLADGLGPTTNLPESIKWYRKSAIQGNADAMYNLGSSYEFGTGVQKNKAKSIRWYREAVKTFKREALKGNVHAMEWLGVMFHEGSGVPKSNALGTKWATKAFNRYHEEALRGNANAQYELGDYYLNGGAVPENHKKAYKWFHRAALGGNVTSMNMIGVMYEYGHGVPKDNKESLRWFKRGAEHGDSIAAGNLSELEASIHGLLQLYGHYLKGATRSQLEPVLAQHGFTPAGGQIGAAWWWDRYNVNGELKGASELDVGYTSGQHFAIAEYTFPSTMDPGQVRRIVAMVTAKYGHPTSVNGDYSVGNVNATWDIGGAWDVGETVEVRRGWPNTTTYLDLIDTQARARMKQEIQNQKIQRQQAQAKKQGGAF